MSTSPLNKTYTLCIPPNGLPLSITLKQLYILCYYQTFSSIGLLLLSGLIVVIERCFLVTTDPQRQQKKAFRLCNQFFLAACLIIYLIWFVSGITYIASVNKQVPADYVAVHMTFRSLAWLIIYLSYQKEQQRFDRFQHLTPYILFVLIAFIIDSCYFMIGDVSEWWWEFNDQGRIALAICYAIRYIATLLALLPLVYNGMLTQHESKSFDYNKLDIQDQEDPLMIQESEANQESEAKQKSLWQHVGNLLKFWHPKLYMSYIYLMVCIILVLLERGINVLAMLYIKWIVYHIIERSPLDILMADLAILATCKFILNSSDGRVGLFTNLRILCWTKFKHSFIMPAQLQIFHCIQRQSYQWFTNLTKRELTGKATDIIYGLNSALDFTEQLSFIIIPTILDIIIIVVFISLLITSWVGCIIVYFIILYYFSVKIGNRYYSQQYQDTKQFTQQEKSVAVHLTTNYETVQLNCSEDSEIKRLGQAIIANHKSIWKMIFTAFWTHSIQSLLAALGLFCGGLAIIKLILIHDLTVGDLVLFIIYVDVLYSCIRILISISSYSEIQNINRMFIILQDLLMYDRDIDLPDLEVYEDGIKMENVSSRYYQRYPAIKNVSLQVTYQQAVALVGSPSSGKDVILKLIYGWYPFHHGTITVFGRNIQLVSRKSLRRNIGYIPKEPKLIRGSIKHNVSYGCLNKCDQDIIKACKLVNIHDKLLSLPEGYETLVGSDELQLRIEDRIKIAIARTILKNPEIVLIEDIYETISNLDDKSMDAIFQSILMLFNDRTILISTNRLELIQKCESIVVIKDGKAIDKGRHKYLRVTNLYYRGLVK